jgi:tripartite-type tricarboxylate transporter receptor subunit TctC
MRKQRRKIMRFTLITLISSAILASLLIVHPVLAADYPDRPIKMFTMTKPGAQIDLLTRKLAEALKAELGQPVLVVNAPGGSHGSVMAMDLKNSKADGYTLGVSATAAYTYSPHFVKTSYGIDDYQFISLLGLNQSGLVSTPDRGWKSIKDAFDWAKKENNSGLIYMFQGSDDRDVMKRIADNEGVKLALMPSQGGPSIISAVMGGHADVGHLGAILFGYVPEKLTLLAASTPTRLKDPKKRKELQDVPTIKEQGWDESVEMFVVLAAPTGLPAAVADKLEKALMKISKDETFREFVATKLKMGPVDYGRDAANTYMKSAYDKFGRQAKAAK